MPLDNLPVEFLFTIDCDTSTPPPVVIGGGPAGTRMIVNVTNGTCAGPKLNGTVAGGPGGDWATIATDGHLRIDVRLVLHTDDGAAILMTYTGIAGADDDGQFRIRAAPRFECGDERYAWLNKVQAVALGSLGGLGVTYDVYRVL